MLAALLELMEAVSPEDAQPETVSRLFFAFLAQHRERLNLLLTSERSREFSSQLDAHLMPFFEKKIRQSYEIPKGMEPDLRTAMEFVSGGYYRFFLNAITDPQRRISRESDLSARLSDACLGLLFRRKSR
jgi:hypothetical protein